MGEKEFSTGEKIGGILFVIWFILSLIALVYVSQTGQKAVAVMLAGQYFIGFDLVYMFSRNKDIMEHGESVMGILPQIAFFVLGAVLIGCGAVYTWGSDEARETLMDNIPAIMGAGFAVVGIGLVVVSIKSLLDDPTRFGAEVDAEVIGIRATTSEVSHKIYHLPTYRYEYNGKTYTVEGGNGSNSLKGTGYKVKIKINPDAPEEVWDVTEMGSSLITIFLGLSFVVAGGVTIYLSQFFRIGG